MRNAILQMPDQRTQNERRQVLRAAIRQLERAEIYVAAVAFLDLGYPAADRAIQTVRAELNGLMAHLSRERAESRP